MRLAILGGGGFRVPLIYRALLDAPAAAGIAEVVLSDPDRGRLDTVHRILDQQAASSRAGRSPVPRVVLSTDLATAVEGADFVFCAVRVGGVQGRIVDERVAIAAGVIGQETVGAGGIAFGLRTVPAALAIARVIALRAPQAWVVNFSNPAGLVTEAMRAELGDRVIGICDSPAGLCRRAAAAVGVDPKTTGFDYAGLNHLGWLRSLVPGGIPGGRERAAGHGPDLLPALLGDDHRLASFEEGRLFGGEWLRALGSIPNEYLHYYYLAREARGQSRVHGPQPLTRGEFLARQQSEFYARAAVEPDRAHSLWEATRRERDATYLAEARELTGGGEREERDVAAGGYEHVALDVLRALSRDESVSLILNVANRATLRQLDADAVIEVSCRVDSSGAHPEPVSPLTDHQAGLVCSVKAVERSVIEAAVTGSRLAAIRAFAEHPLVDSVSVARTLLNEYSKALPELSYLR